MITSTLHFPVPHKFNFQRTMFSHGWCALPPFSTSEDRTVLKRILRLTDGMIVKVNIRSSHGSKLAVEALAVKRLTKIQKADLHTQIASCLRLNEDFSEFYRFVRTLPQYRWIAKTGSGRLLRAPALFEDIVKMICTTNCSWALTRTLHFRNPKQSPGARTLSCGNIYAQDTAPRSFWNSQNMQRTKGSMWNHGAVIRCRPKSYSSGCVL